MVFERKRAKCLQCPYRERRRVWGQGADKPLFAIIGEAPGQVEESLGRPFAGPAGSYLSELLAAAGLPRGAIWFTNPICCRPPLNDINTVEARTAIECCRPGFQDELALIHSSGCRVFVPVGNRALIALGLGPGISQHRGYVWPLGPGTVAIPTFHPSYLLRGQTREKPTVICDLAKAGRIAEEGWKRPIERFKTNPTLQDLKTFLKSLKKGQLVGVDIETTSLDPTEGEIVVIGLASSETTAISVPYLKRGGLPYWGGQHNAAKRIVQQIFLKSSLIFQNALFDVRWLLHDGYEIPDPVDDLLLLHHAVHPELPHSLRYIASVYTSVPSWKGVLHDRVGRITDMPDKELRTYNLRDAAVLLRAFPSVLDDARTLGVEQVYRDEALPLVRPILEMVECGIPLSQRKLRDLRADLERESSALEQGMRADLGLPDAWRPSVPDHVRLLVYPVVPRQFVRASEEMEEFDRNPKRRRDTKLFRDIERSASLARIHHLYQPPRVTNRTTESGSSFSIDEESLLERSIAARRRLEEIQGFKKKEADPREVLDIQKLVKFLEDYARYTETTKILSTFTEFPVGKEGHVHTSYIIHGTATGRLSSRDPNLQNVPKKVRKVFVAPEGYVFVRADYSNLELRVLAWVSKDEPAMDMFEAGLNAHDENTKTMLKITPDDPSWEVKRKGIKMGRFAKNYGGSDEAIYRKLLLAVPDFGLTFKQYQEAERRYEKAHPAWKSWFDKTVQEVLKTKMLRTCFGRLRIFLGDSYEICREGPNFLIQSPAASIINKATISLYREMHQKGLESRLCAQVHDELTCLCPEDESDQVRKMMEDHMQRKYRVNGSLVSFPVEIVISKEWA